MDQNQVFDSIGTAFNKPDLSHSFMGVGTAVTLFALITFGTLYFFQTRHQWKGRWLYLKKRLKGEAVSKDRVLKNIEIVIQLPYRDTPFRTRVYNMSPNGMFVKMNPPLQVGESFRFLLTLNGDEKITAWAEVRWSQDKRTPYTPPGMGCKFFHMDDADRLRIKKFLRS